MLEKMVNEGIKLLNKQRPGWFNDIDLDKLSLEECAHCVLGQLYDGNFCDGLKHLGISNEVNYYYGYDSGYFAPRYGFDLDVDGRVNKEWDELNELWVKKITELKQKVNKKSWNIFKGV